MNKNAFESICAMLSASGAEFRVLTHSACKTSSESAAQRTAAGVPNSVGAKAILCKLYYREKEEFSVFVMPGTHRLDTPAVKAALVGLRKLRFASSDEMFSLCGVLPGCMPPFGKSIFPGISNLYIDAAIQLQPNLGFNAADFCRSIVVSGRDYVRSIAHEAKVFTFSIPGGQDADSA